MTCSYILDETLLFPNIHHLDQQIRSPRREPTNQHGARSAMETTARCASPGPPFVPFCQLPVGDLRRPSFSGLRDRPGPQIRLAVLEFPSFWQVILARKIEYLHDNEGKSSSELLCSTEAPIRGLKASRARTGSQVQSEGEGVLVLFIALRTTVQLDRN